MVQETSLEDVGSLEQKGNLLSSDGQGFMVS